MGELVERSNTSVLKTEGGKPSVSSNLTLTSVSGRLLKWQREKTVNLRPSASEVRVLQRPQFGFRGNSSVGRALP